MKIKFLKKTLTTTLIIFSGILVFGQDEVAVPDEEVQCEIELSNMTEFMKIDLPEYAYQAWMKLFNYCPDASKNIYVSGAKIYQKKIRRAKNPERRQELFDTLMLIYDRRIQYYGEEGYVYGRKGMDIMRLNEKEYPLAYESFKKSADFSGSETHLNVITGYIQTGSVMMKSEKISPSEFLDDYTLCLNILDGMKEKGESEAKVNRVESVLEEILANTRIEDCGVIQEALKDRVYTEAPDPDFLKVGIDLLTISGCESTEFFSDINEKLMEIDPDPEKAYQVAKYNLKNGNFEKAAEYLLKAIDNEEVEEDKAYYEYQLSVVYLSELGKPAEAKKYAMSAVQHKPGWGDPYFVAANAILEGVKSCSSLEQFDRQAAYWLATDYVLKAKSEDPSIEQRANETIARYKTNYPSVEDNFFRSLKKGDQFVIGCWINETTSVKE